MWRLIETVIILTAIAVTGRVFMTKNQEIIDRIADQLDKVRDEVVGGIADLQAQVAAGEELDFSRLSAIVQDIDDLHEDESVEPEVPVEPETPEEETPEEPVEGADVTV